VADGNRVLSAVVVTNMGEVRNAIIVWSGGQRSVPACGGLDASSAVYTRTAGVSPNRSFLVEWRNARFYSATTLRIDVELELSENGHIVLRYRNLDSAQPLELGSSATVGIENAAGTIALQYSANSPTLSNTQAIRFRPPGT